MLKLESIDDLEELLRQSQEEPVVLFKHSLACGVSFSAKREVEDFLATRTGARSRVAILEIQNQRSLSIEVADRMAVRHASPQVLIIFQGESVWNASHWKITAARLEAAIAEVANLTAAEA